VEGRTEQEIALLRTRYPSLDFVTEGKWVKIPAYPLPPGWSASQTDVVFQVPPAYPGTQPYGFFVPQGLTYQGSQPDSYAVSNETIPFPGTWGKFSWTHEDGNWRPAADPLKGSNLVNWVIGFSERFKGGK
jgi:hypothetical protein